jgi:hypothetical protein
MTACEHQETITYRHGRWIVRDCALCGAEVHSLHLRVFTNPPEPRGQLVHVDLTKEWANEIMQA